MGLSEGLVVPLAVAIGLHLARQPLSIVVIPVLAQAVAGALAMALGNYSTAKEEMNAGADTGQEETFYTKLGMDENLSGEIAMDTLAERKRLAYESVSDTHVAKKALLTGVGYLLGGAWVAMLYYGLHTMDSGFLIMILVMLASVGMVSVAKSRLRQENVGGQLVRSLLVAAGAGIATWLVVGILINP